jgi:hypothetical protein
MKKSGGESEKRDSPVFFNSSRSDLAGYAAGIDLGSRMHQFKPS